MNEIINCFKDKYFTLFWFFIFSLFISQTAMDIFAVIIVGLFLFNIKKFDFMQQNIKIYLLLSLLFFLNILIGFIINKHLNLYSASRLFEVTWTIIPLAFCYLLGQIKFNPLKIKIIILTIILIIFLSAFYYFEITYQFRDNPRFGGAYGDPMTFAHVCGLFLSFIFYFVLSAFSKKASLETKSIKNILVLFFVILNISVLFSQTRGVWVSLFLTFLLVAFIQSRKIVITFLVSVPVLFTSLYFGWQSFKAKVDLTFSRTDTSLLERYSIWRANWQIFIEHPIFGVGWGVNNQLLPEYYKRLSMFDNILVSHSHNQFLHFLSGTGIIGLLIYLSFFVFISKITFLVYKENSTFVKAIALAIFAVQFNFLLSGLTESNFERARVRYVLLLSWGLLFFVIQKIKKEELL